jgi:hypothetical protein
MIITQCSIADKVQISMRKTQVSDHLYMVSETRTVMVVEETELHNRGAELGSASAN